MLLHHKEEVEELATFCMSDQVNRAQIIPVQQILAFSPAAHFLVFFPPMPLMLPLNFLGQGVSPFCWLITHGTGSPPVVYLHGPVQHLLQCSVCWHNGQCSPLQYSATFRGKEISSLSLAIPFLQ